MCRRNAGARCRRGAALVVIVVILKKNSVSIYSYPAMGFFFSHYCVLIQ